MPLSTGDKLGPHEILGPLGAGGMGEVYKARDTRLDRTVAIKVLPEHIANRDDLRERFEREARAVASLHHPHICVLYDIGQQDGVGGYMVMEFLDGETLAARLARGPLPLAMALQYAIQIADALDRAHRAGVTHRDIKLGNIMVTRDGVKVLDFGLAKSRSKPGPADATVVAALTTEGTLLGTPQYMAPEQFEGKEADARSDIFAFGLVLYEMLAGRPAFEGKTYASLIAAIMGAEPKPVTSFQPQIPPALVHLIDTCLAKDPDDRRQSMHDVLLELRWIAGGGSQAVTPPPAIPKPAWRKQISWALAGVASVAALAFGFLYSRQTTPPVFPVRFEQAVPPLSLRDSVFGNTPAVAPDGRSFAYTGVKEGTTSVLWIRRLAEVQATPLPGTENASRPFWSPDSRFLAFYADGKLKKIDTNGGPPQVLCNTSYFGGGTWNGDGLILFGTREKPLQKIPAAGGEPKPLLKLDNAGKQTGHGFPHFLPDGRHFFYTSYDNAGKNSIYLGSIDSPQTRMLLDAATNATFVSPGLLVFGRDRMLMAQPFDAGKLQLSGDPFPVADQVASAGSRSSTLEYSSSPNGVLVYRQNSTGALGRQPVWYNREGKRLATAGEPRLYMQGSLSPDEKRFAVQIRDSNTPAFDIWMLDLTSSILSRITSGSARKDTVYWSPDGREILFSSNKTGVMNLYRKPAGGGDEQLVRASTKSDWPLGWLPDGSILFLNGSTFYRLAPGAGAKPEALLKSEHSIDELRVSPDGRWATYNSNETGRHEVYVAAFPSFTERRQVSSNGGAQGYWRKDGKELFYLSLDGNMVSVAIKAGATLEAGIPKVLFPVRLSVESVLDQYAATGDGQRFLVLEPFETAVKPFTVVLNWPAALRK